MSEVSENNDQSKPCFLSPFLQTLPSLVTSLKQGLFFFFFFCLFFFFFFSFISYVTEAGSFSLFFFFLLLLFFLLFVFFLSFFLSFFFFSFFFSFFSFFLLFLFVCFLSFFLSPPPPFFLSLKSPYTCVPKSPLQIVLTLSISAPYVKSFCQKFEFEDCGLNLALFVFVLFHFFTLGGRARCLLCPPRLKRHPKKRKKN